MADAILEWLSSEGHVRETTGHTEQWPQREAAYFAVLGLSRQIEGVIHVAGTKGKGSTCTLVDSLLRSCGYRTGLFTSPHLHDVRERIRVQGALVETETFNDAVLWCHDRLRRLESDGVPFPHYFTFLTLVALRAFGDAQLDAVILEVGLGGRFDPTNVIYRPWVCGITLIGMDHMEILGETLEAIAWQKGGILKKDMPAYTMHQHPAAMAMLQRCAHVAGTELHRTSPTDYHNWQDVQRDAPLSGFQLTNASLAVHLAQDFEKAFYKRRAHASPSFIQRMQCLEKGLLPQEYLHGLSTFECTGRAQIIKGPHLPSSNGNYCEAANVCFYLDGAHTQESLEACVDWIQPHWQQRDGHDLNFLLFNCHQPREPHVLLKSLHQRMLIHQLLPHYTCFAPVMTPRKNLIPLRHRISGVEWQERQLAAWCALCRAAPSSSPTSPVPLPSLKSFTMEMSSAKRRFPDVKADVFASLPSAMEWFGAVAQRQPSCRIRILVTGSLYFVSDVISLLKRKPLL